MRLYYLTTAHYALDDIARRRVKVSLFHDLNDPFELLCAKVPTRNLRKGFKNVKDHIHGRIGVICFSTEWSSPLMWSHYGDKHRGICLGFDVPDEFAIEIKYIKVRDAAAAEAIASNRRPDAEFANRLMTSKYDAWTYEKERRLYVGLEECDKKTGMYFYEFGPNLTLREVILGPRCDATLSEARRVALRVGPEVIAYKARLAFNTFDVVPNQNTIRRQRSTA
jgi:hypothetical protein